MTYYLMASYMFMDIAKLLAFGTADKSIICLYTAYILDTYTFMLVVIIKSKSLLFISLFSIIKVLKHINFFLPIKKKTQ